MILAWFSSLPVPFGNTRSRLPFGQASFHSFKVFNARGPNGMVRSPDSDFGLPISLKRSARWLANLKR